MVDIDTAAQAEAEAQKYVPDLECPVCREPKP